MKGLDPPAVEDGVEVVLLIVAAVELEDVDDIGLEAAEAVLGAFDDALPIVVGELGGEDDLVPAPGDDAAEDFLAGALAVGGRGVEVVEAEVEGAVEGVGDGLLLALAVGVPGLHVVGDADLRAAEADLGDFEAGAAEGAVLHGGVLSR